MTPCDQCHRMHRGRTCKPADRRSVSVCVTLPVYVHAQMVEQVPYGERSSWLAGLVERELNIGPLPLASTKGLTRRRST